MKILANLLTLILDEVCEELGEAGEEVSRDPAAIELEEEVGEGVGRRPVLVLVQDSHQQLTLPDHHLPDINLQSWRLVNEDNFYQDALYTE
jgi:hypothetical protein